MLSLQCRRGEFCLFIFHKETLNTVLELTLTQMYDTKVWFKLRQGANGGCKYVSLLEQQGEFLLFCYQHCFRCRPSDFTESEYAGIELRTVATLALAVRHSNHSARSTKEEEPQSINNVLSPALLYQMHNVGYLISQHIYLYYWCLPLPATAVT
jgi:hypothetical protein